MNWDLLEEQICEAVRISYTDIVENFSSERIYAFAIYTDADCYTILPTANTIDQYEKKISTRNIVEPERKPSYKWYIGEWKYEAWKDEAFNSICEELGSAAESASMNNTRLDFKKQVHQCMLNSLYRLKNEGLFPNSDNEFVIFISSSDYDDAKLLEEWSAKILNDQGVYEKFEKRYQLS